MINPDDPAEVEIHKLRKINAALMSRVERATDISGSAFALFQTAIALESEVRARTRDLQGVLDDLSETNARLEQAHAEAERARSNLADALEAVEEGFALYGPDDRLVMCNRRYRSLLPDIAHLIGPGLKFADYVRYASQSTSLALAEGQAPDAWAVRRMEVHGRRHTTLVVALSDDRWIQVSERRTANGTVAVIQTDITHLVRQQRRERDKILDEQARLAQATLEHLSQGVCTFDTRGELAGCNSRFRDLLNLPFNLAKPGVGLGTIVDYIRRNSIVETTRAAGRLQKWAAKPPPRIPIAAELRRTDGSIIDVGLNDIPLGGFIASLTDVTAERRAIEELHKAKATLALRVEERTAALTAANEALKRENAERTQIGEALREAKEAAEAANLSKTRFLAAASHDLLQPLNAAKLFVATLGEMPAEPEQREVIERLSGAFNSVETLLHSLLDISRLDAGRADFTLIDFPLSSVLRPLEQEFKPLAAARGLRLRVRGLDVRVRSDPHYFRRIAQNLVANAVNYTRRGGVLIGCRKRGGFARFEVWDTGPGLKPEDRVRIFEEFQRLDPDSRHRGMGLGLSIVQRACRLLNHPLSLRSEPGMGSVFAVDLPIAATVVEGAGEISEVEDGATSAAGLNIIAAVVENEPEVLYAMTRTLEGWGASVLPAASTVEVKRACADLGLAPDIIIADYHLEGNDTGFVAIRELRTVWGAEIPALLVTADRTKDVAAEARRMGIDVLSKPVEPRKLRSLITWRSMATL